MFKNTACTASLILAAVMVTFSLAVSAQARPTENQRTVNVTGSAAIIVPADRVTLNVIVETKNEQIAGAKRANDAIVQAASRAMTALGVQADQIKTEQMQLEPVQESFDDKSSGRTRMVVTGYTVRRVMAITLTDVKKFDAALTALFEARVNHLLNVSFSVNNLRQLRDQARQQAARAAREKAQLLATEFNQKIGIAISFSEQANDWSPYYGRYYGGYGSQNQNVRNYVRQNSSSDGDHANETGDAAPGQVTVSSTVQATFELVK